MMTAAELREALKRVNPLEPTALIGVDPGYPSSAFAYYVHEVYSYPELKTMKLIPKKVNYGTMFTVENTWTPLRVMEQWRSHLLRHCTQLVGVHLENPQSLRPTLVVRLKSDPTPNTWGVIRRAKPLHDRMDLRIVWDE